MFYSAAVASRSIVLVSASAETGLLHVRQLRASTKKTASVS
jgi:hypothetical protein